MKLRSASHGAVNKGVVMGRAFILWLLGVPVSVLILLWVVGILR